MTASPQSPPAPPRPRAIVIEALGAFLFATVAVSLLYRLRGVPIIERNLAVVAAVLFLYVPAYLTWRRGEDLDAYGLRLRPLGKGLLMFLALTAVTVPLFSLGYSVFIRHLCKLLPRALVYCPPVASFRLRLPPELLLTALSQLLVVALPEELFFRGYLQGRLSLLLPTRQALVLTAALFALGHFLVTFEPSALAVFFPGLLFGVMRWATGSVLAGTLFHATCNLLIDTLHRSFA